MNKDPGHMVEASFCPLWISSYTVYIWIHFYCGWFVCRYFIIIIIIITLIITLTSISSNVCISRTRRNSYMCSNFIYINTLKLLLLLSVPFLLLRWWKDNDKETCLYVFIAIIIFIKNCIIAIVVALISFIKSFIRVILI